jgi:hypothetical protein
MLQADHEADIDLHIPYTRLNVVKVRSGYKFNFSLPDVVYNSSPDCISSNYLNTA